MDECPGVPMRGGFTGASSMEVPSMCEGWGAREVLHNGADLPLDARLSATAFL